MPENEQTEPLSEKANESTASSPNQSADVTEPTIAQPQTVSSGAASPTSSGHTKKLGLMAAIVTGLIILVGGSAGAYYGVIVPNKPENVLKEAVKNTLSQKKTKFDGSLSYESTDKNASIKAVNATFNGSADADAKAFSVATEATASGIKVPLELRYVANSIYIKPGDLSSLKAIVQATAPAYVPTFETLNKKLANQWLEVDQTLLKQANTDCATNINFSLTQEDFNLLEKRYNDVPFASIKSKTNDTVNGRQATKFEIAIDDNKSVEYGKGLDNLSIIKKIKECDKKATATDKNATGDGDTTPITLWVDKNSKQIVKLAGKSTAQDEQKSKFKASFEVTMQYGQASISKPEGAKPFMEVFGDFSQLLGLGSGPIKSTYDSSSDATDSSISPACLKEIQDYSSSGGTKPIPSCL